MQRGSLFLQRSSLELYMIHQGEVKECTLQPNIGKPTCFGLRLRWIGLDANDGSSDLLMWLSWWSTIILIIGKLERHQGSKIFSGFTFSVHYTGRMVLSKQCGQNAIWSSLKFWIGKKKSSYCWDCLEIPCTLFIALNDSCVLSSAILFCWLRNNMQPPLK